ncbi:MAG TPA: hypothetical protein GX519_02980, partial [Thermoanaerobacterales bacterium]|nr:hypothetical protein [Thermoanaerobacterales bacterium]
MNFVDDFNEAKRILESLKKSGVKIEPIIYQTVIQTVDTLKQAIQVYNEIVNNGIDPTVGTYITLIEKQKTYKDARKILDKYVLSNQYYRERLYTKQAHKNDPLQNIFAILYLKAKRDEEIQQVKKELKFVGMSTDINDYDYFTFKSSKRWAYECRKRLLERGNLSSYIHEVNKFLGISNDEQKTLKSKKNNDTINKIKKVINVYDRNATISDNIKYLYSDCCQVCGKRLDIGSKFYSEVHHIHPLYLNGPDVPENMICLCPNHHILFDRGAITINLEDKTIVHINGTVEDINGHFLGYMNCCP